MKITRIRTFLMQAGAPRALGASAAAKNWQAEGRNWLFIKVETDAGLTGIGECSGWPRVIERAVEDLSHVLIGEDAIHIELIWQRMLAAIMGHGMTGVVGAGAMAGIDMALWDLKGKALRAPVWSLLGGRMRATVPIYGHASGPEAALSLVSRGIRAVKLGGARDIVRRVAKVREAVGAEVDIMVDLAGPPWLTAADAIAIGRALEPYDLLFMEDPLAPEHIDQYLRVRDAVAIPLAAGERMSTIWGMRPLIERELVDVIQPDTGRAGGITQLRKIAAMAEAHGIMVAPHSGSLGPVAEFAALHLMASIPNALMLERVIEDWSGRNEVIERPPAVVDDGLRVPDEPGLGVDIVEAAIARYPSVRNVGIATPTADEALAYVAMRRQRAVALRRKPVE